ncbi:Transcriptional regulator, ARAC family [Seminavis robusta]|uniref:Transcriptional regulator, ARAC family n=1 Tax=Seminavis robusta TaxID=568900 RepID=A0A9N8F258_9STRA|nr:Transcriptional regulator, ARAC family [Seminavis robusta]|eukprot:Sro2769_g336710.1 Transcriptional regulator, ARAC family (213) ;mRNA; f:6651-7289
MTTTNDDEPKLIETETKKFWGIIGKGPFDGCGAAFKKLGELQKKVFADDDDNKIRTAMLVLCDVPNTKNKEDLVWAAAMLIPDSVESKVPEGLEEIVVEGRRCATSMHRGGYEGLPKSWGQLCMKWIPSQKLRPCKGSRECPHYEVYMNDCSNGTKKEDLETQLFAPVEPAEENEEKKQADAGDCCSSNNKHPLEEDDKKKQEEPEAKKAKE